MRGSDSIIEKIMEVVKENKSSSSLASPKSNEYEQNCGHGVDNNEESEDSAEDEQNMGSARVYTIADRRLLAKYIASVENWERKNDLQRFTAFYERVSYRFFVSF